MAYYITYGEFQRHMKEYYLRTGNRMQFPEMINYLYNKGLLMDTPPQPLPSSRIFGDMDDDEFNEIAKILSEDDECECECGDDCDCGCHNH